MLPDSRHVSMSPVKYFAQIFEHLTALVKLILKSYLTPKVSYCN